jgi:hypothetical protein
MSDTPLFDIKPPVTTKAKKTKVKPKELVILSETDPARELPGGTYLDRVERERAEVARAKVEGREPDLDNPPACAGTPVITKNQYDKATGYYTKPYGL